MKEILGPMVQQALKAAFSSGDLRPEADLPPVLFEIPKVAAHGDFSTNIAMTMAAAQKRAPREIARIIIDHMEDSGPTFSSISATGLMF
jgi:arginyl-tRNA synthetase